MGENHNMARCKQCDHLLSFHGEDGCGTWLLGVRAVPLYRCACVVSVSAKPKNFPTVSTSTHTLPAPKEYQYTDTAKAQVAKLVPASEASTRNRLQDVASELRRTAEELKSLELLLDKALARFAGNDASNDPQLSKFPPTLSALPKNNRRKFVERRQRHYAMLADRRMEDRRTKVA